MSQPDKLRIGLMTHSINPRGGVVHALELGSALHRAGHQVRLIAPALPGQKLFRDIPFDLTLIRVPERAGSLLNTIRQRIDICARFLTKSRELHDLDVVHAQDGLSANALGNSCRSVGRVDYVRTVHHLDRFESPELQSLEESSIRQARLVLCVSRHWQRLLKDQLGVEAHQVGNGVDLTRYNCMPDTKDDLVRATWGLRTGAPVILSVGGVEERKNSLRTLDAFTRLRDRWPDAQWLIVGGASVLDHSDYRTRFASRLAALGLNSGPGGDVIEAGVVPDAQMPAIFRAASVLAFPSLREGFGLVVLEALACGTPVAVPRQPPFCEYLEKADACWLDPDDVDSVVHALAEGIENPQLTTPNVVHRFNWEASAMQHVALYQRLLAERPLSLH